MEDAMSEVTWFKIFPDGNKCFVVDMKTSNLEERGN
jgi:hypothetical protein